MNCKHSISSLCDCFHYQTSNFGIKYYFNIYCSLFTFNVTVFGKKKLTHNQPQKCSRSKHCDKLHLTYYREFRKRNFHIVNKFRIHLPLKLDVHEESEADLVSERKNNNNDWYRLTLSRSPDVYYSKGSKNDRKLSSGYFISPTFYLL